VVSALSLITRRVGRFSVRSHYKVSAKVDINTLQQMDQDDESLVKYKAALLGNIDSACSRTLTCLLHSTLLPCLSALRCPCVHAY